VVCVVEEPHNIVGIEATREFEGRYHVLHGSLSPLRGMGPESLKIKGLVERIGQGEIEEVIVALTPPWKARPPGSTWRACSSRWA
jgi:recombination protein RecR